MLLCDFGKFRVVILLIEILTIPVQGQFIELFILALTGGRRESVTVQEYRYSTCGETGN